MLNEEDRALSNFREVVERPDTHLALVSSSLCYSCYSFIKYKRYSEALDAINESININPHSSVSYKYAILIGS
jgi:hypothetical protein